jgi:hypothetical protein
MKGVGKGRFPALISVLPWPESGSNRLKKPYRGHPRGSAVARGYPPHGAPVAAFTGLSPFCSRIHLLPLSVSLTLVPAIQPTVLVLLVMLWCALCHSSLVLVDQQSSLSPLQPISPRTNHALLLQEKATGQPAKGARAKLNIIMAFPSLSVIWLRGSFWA